MAAAVLLVAMSSCQKDKGKDDENNNPPAEQVSRVFEDFENGGILKWNGNDGCQFKVVANPNKSGINTSDMVGEYTTAAAEWDFVWTSGFGDTIDPATGEPKWESDKYVPVDFEKGWLIKVQCLAPAAGIPIYCKLEIDGGNGQEITNVKTTKANEWEDLEFDFEPLALESGKYCDFVFCVDAGGTTAGTKVYLDNIRQVKGE